MYKEMKRAFFPNSDACWLHSALESTLRWESIDVLGRGSIADTIRAELDLIGVSDVSASARLESSIVFATVSELGKTDAQLARQAEEIVPSDGEAFAIFSAASSRVITARSERGLLYGYFHLLLHDAHVRGGSTIVDAPRRRIRMINQWDNMTEDRMGSVERGYSGDSIFYRDGRLVDDTRRIADYARLLASVGINAICINNVNVHEVETRLLVDQLDAVSRVVSIFADYGIKTYTSINFAAPIDVGGLATADPLSADVVAWWKDLIDNVYRAIPGFGGFVSKADSEGRPGPFDYGRDHSDGANMLARLLKPHGGLVFWRAFVYNSQQDWRDRSTDRARAAFDHFIALDGNFDDNVVLQIKNGPIDFQVREPISPLLAALQDTNIGLELQIAQEYTGQQIDVFYLPRHWEEILRFDFNAGAGDGATPRTVSSIVSERGEMSAIIGVSNIGSDENWTGNTLAQSNLFGFGLQAWNDDITSDEVLDQWLDLTFDRLAGSNRQVVRDLIFNSVEVYENYTAPLGVGFMITPHTHYGPSVDGYEYSRWGTYHFADRDGVGVDRSARTGSGYSAQYPSGWARTYENVDTCPDELLLFFHHVPYTHQLRSGETVIQHIYDSHFEGYEQVEDMISSWESVRSSVDDTVFASVAERLELQRRNAREWRDQIVTYFLRKSGIRDTYGRISWE